MNCVFRIYMTSHLKRISWQQWRTEGGFGGFKKPRNFEVLTKLSRIPNSIEYTSITAWSEYGFHSFANWVDPWLGGYRPQIPVLSALCPQLNLLNPSWKKFWVCHWLTGTVRYCLCASEYMLEDLSFLFPFNLNFHLIYAIVTLPLISFFSLHSMLLHKWISSNPWN
jgi:hypothetical protein